MRPLYYATSDECEAQAIFDKDGTLLGLWALNDATWRNEYFSGFMEKLGFQIEYDSSLEYAVTQAAEDMWG